MIDEGGIENPSGWPGGDRRAWKNLMWGGQGKLKYQPERGDGQVWKCSTLEVESTGFRVLWAFSARPHPYPLPCPFLALSL